MANEMRDRLVESMAKRFKELHKDGDWNFNEMLVGVADYLLDDGWVRLPCKAGDTVYLIPTYNGKPYCGIWEDKVQMIGVTSRGVHIKARNHHDHNKMYMLGKSIFLTKAEAEQKLKEMRGGNGNL